MIISYLERLLENTTSGRDTIGPRELIPLRVPTISYGAEARGRINQGYKDSHPKRQRKPNSNDNYGKKTP